MADILKSLKVGEYVSDEKLIAEIERNREAIAELVAALTGVMSWIDNWEPEFINDSEWPYYEEKARAAITKHDTQPTKKGSN